MANVADIHTIIEIPGHIGIYEVMTGQAILVKECTDREEASPLVCSSLTTPKGYLLE